MDLINDQVGMVDEVIVDGLHTLTNAHLPSIDEVFEEAAGPHLPTPTLLQKPKPMPRRIFWDAAPLPVGPSAVSVYPEAVGPSAVYVHPEAIGPSAVSVNPEAIATPMLISGPEHNPQPSPKRKKLSMREVYMTRK